MRTLIVAAALALAAHPVAAATFIERLPPQEVDLVQLVDKPQTYQNMRVKFRCMFVESGNLFDPIHTQFFPERYVNLVVWDDTARIWEPEVRAKPIYTIYVDKARASNAEVVKLHKYEMIDIIGEVSSSYRNEPWVNIHEIVPVQDAGAFTDNVIYHVEQAGKLRQEGAYDLAETHYDAALKEDLPMSGKILIAQEKARNLLLGGHYGDAAGVLEHALDQAKEHKHAVSSGDEASLHYLLAKALTEMAGAGGKANKERYEGAVSHARAAVALDPALGDAYAVLGIGLAGLEQYDDARQECARAIRLQPTNAEVRWYLGRILDLQKQFDPAIEALKKAIDLTPKDERMHEAIANAYLHRSQESGPNAATDLATALREFDIAIRLDPANPRLYCRTGEVVEDAVARKVDVQIGVGKKPASVDLAIERYEAACTADAKYLPAHLALIRLYGTENKPELALKHQQAAIELDPKHVEPYLALAASQEQQGKKEDALATYEKAAKVDAGNADVVHAIGRLSIELAKPDQHLLEAWVEKHPKDAKAHLDLAAMLITAGNAKDGLRHAKAGRDAAGDDEDKTRGQTLIDQAHAAGAK